MGAATDNRHTPAAEGRSYLDRFPVKAGVHIFAGTLVAVGATGLAQPAADAAGLLVKGRALAEVDNRNGDDGALEIAVGLGIHRYANSATHALARAGLPAATVAYVENDQTVGSAVGSHGIAAGLVYDVDADGVWVDQQSAALALAQHLAAPSA